MCLKHFVLNFFKHLYFFIPLIKSLSRPSKVRFRNTGIFSPLFVFGNNHWIKTPLPKLQQLWLLLYEVNSFYNRNWKHLCFRVWLKKRLAQQQCSSWPQYLGQCFWQCSTIQASPTIPSGWASTVRGRSPSRTITTTSTSPSSPRMVSSSAPWRARYGTLAYPGGGGSTW